MRSGGENLHFRNKNGADFLLPVLAPKPLSVAHPSTEVKTTLPSHFYCFIPVNVRSRCESWSIKKLSSKELMLLNCGVGEDS